MRAGRDAAVSTVPSPPSQSFGRTFKREPWTVHFPSTCIAVQASKKLALYLFLLMMDTHLVAPNMHPVDVLTAWYWKRWRGPSRPTVFRSARVVKHKSYERPIGDTTEVYTLSGTPHRVPGEPMLTRPVFRAFRTFHDENQATRGHWIDPSHLFPGILQQGRHIVKNAYLSMTIPWQNPNVPTKAAIMTPAHAYEMIHECRIFFRRLARHYIYVEYDHYSTQLSVGKNARRLKRFIRDCIQSDMPYTFKRIIYDTPISKLRDVHFKDLQLPRISHRIRHLEAAYHTREERLQHPELEGVYQEVYQDLVRIGYELGILPTTQCATWDEYQRETCKAVRNILEQERVATPVDDVLRLISAQLPLNIHTMLYMCTSTHMQEIAIDHSKARVKQFDLDTPDEVVDILMQDASPSVFLKRVELYHRIQIIRPEDVRAQAMINTRSTNQSPKHRQWSKRWHFHMMERTWEPACLFLARFVASGAQQGLTLSRFVQCLNLTESYDPMKVFFSMPAFLGIPGFADQRPLHLLTRIPKGGVTPVHVYCDDGTLFLIRNEGERETLEALRRHPQYYVYVAL